MESKEHSLLKEQEKILIKESYPISEKKDSLSNIYQ